jgi:hypothetical protein
MLSVSHGSQVSSGGIATGYGLDDLGAGVGVPVESRMFSSLSRPDQSPSQHIPVVLYAEVKRPGREADRSPPPSAEVNKMWIYTTTPPCVFMS